MQMNVRTAVPRSDDDDFESRCIINFICIAHVQIEKKVLDVKWHDTMHV